MKYKENGCVCVYIYVKERKKEFCKYSTDEIKTKEINKKVNTVHNERA